MKKMLFIIFSIVIILIFFLVLIYFYILPSNYYKTVKENAIKYKFKPKFLMSVINAESRYNKDARSHKGAIGLMQIRPSTAKWIAQKIKKSNYSLLDYKDNIELGTAYLRYLFDKYKSTKKVLIAYNAGERNLKNGNWNNFKETNNYLQKVKVFNFLYEVFYFWLK